MKRFIYITAAIAVALIGVAAFAASMHSAIPYATGITVDEDTVVPFTVRHAGDPQGIEPRRTGDLHDPENIKTGVFYDEKTGTYS